MNAGFEDCQVLDDLMTQFSDDRRLAFCAFSERRRPDADAICELALYNYKEMSTLVTSVPYRIKQTLYRWLHRAFPRTIIPLYTMVAFTQIPYAQIVRRARRQDLAIASGTAGVLGLVALLGWRLCTI